MKIIGRGLIARSFSGCSFSKECVIIASGVSNSQEYRDSEFEREALLLEETIRKHPHSKIVYYSTTSVLQSEQTPYVKHKLEMEQLILAESNSFAIFRLPQIVGVVNNSTLISFLVTSIVHGHRMSLQRFAERNLLDIFDLVRLTKLFIENDIASNCTITLAGSQNVSVIDIVQEISKIIGKDALYDLIEAGQRIELDISILKAHVDSSDPIFSNDYWKTVLRKYVPLLIAID